MSKFTVHDTIRQSDIDALVQAGARVGLGGGASLPGTERPVHLELRVQIDDGQIEALKGVSFEAFTKFRFGVIFGAGIYEFHCFHFEDDIVRAADGGYRIRVQRATGRHGGTGEIADAGWW